MGLSFFRKLKLVILPQAIKNILPAIGNQFVYVLKMSSLVSIIGIGMKTHAGVAQKMFETLSQENININVISTSEIKLSVLIERKYLELAVRSLHDALGLQNL